MYLILPCIIPNHLFIRFPSFLFSLLNQKCGRCFFTLVFFFLIKSFWFYFIFCRHLMVKDWGGIEWWLLEVLIFWARKMTENSSIHRSRLKFRGRLNHRAYDDTGRGTPWRRLQMLLHFVCTLEGPAVKSHDECILFFFFLRIPQLPHHHPCRWWPISFESSSIHYVFFFSPPPFVFRDGCQFHDFLLLFIFIQYQQRTPRIAHTEWHKLQRYSLFCYVCFLPHVWGNRSINRVTSGSIPANGGGRNRSFFFLTSPCTEKKICLLVFFFCAKVRAC